MLKKLINRYLMYKNPFKFARKQGAKIGEHCYCASTPIFGSEPWLIEIGNNVIMSGRVTFITHDGAHEIFKKEEKYKNALRYGKIIVHDNCFIGMGAFILPGVEIGENSIIGVGSVVTKSIPANSVYAGNPAHFICTLDEYKERCLNGTPDYDIEAYHTNKRETVLKMLEGKMRM